MNKKKVITIMLLLLFILSSLMPIMRVNAATNETITLNSALYKAVKAELQAQNVPATYNDAQYTLTISQDAIKNVTKLNLPNKEISDLTGLGIFSNLTSLDLSANDLSKDSHLEVLNSFKLNYLDLSSNEISDVSSITGIKDIATLNLHNQIFNEVVIINNAAIKEGTLKYEVQLPQIIRAFGKPIKSEWLKDSYINNSSSNVKFDWASFNANSDSIKLTIGANNSNPYNGLATLKIKVTDMNNTLYNSEINFYCVVINEDQRAIAIKDRNLYEALKAQLTKGQTVNTELTKYTVSKNLYDYAYDEQMIFVINENTLVNEIKSLVLDNKKIKDLSGIEMFIGLETALNVASNYISTIDRIVDLQATKEAEGTKLQERYKEKAAQLKERIEKIDTLNNELKNVIKSYNEAVGKYNSYVGSADQNKIEKMLEQLGVIKEQAKKYIQLTGNPVVILGVNYTTVASLDNLTTVREMTIAALPEKPTVNGGELGEANQKKNAKFLELYDMYNKIYKVTSVVTPELRNITDQDYEDLTLEKAKALLQAQVTKITSIEKSVTSYEKAYLSTYYGLNFSNEEKTPITTYFTEKMKDLEEAKDVAGYKAELDKLRIFDSFVTITNKCLINLYKTGSNVCVGEPTEELEEKAEDFQNTHYITEGFNRHKLYTITSISNDDINALVTRLGNASNEDIADCIVLPKLRCLIINENLIENIDKISTLKDLRKLYVADNEIVNIKNVDWSAMAMLNVLNLSFNNISDIKPLEALKNMMLLNLSKNLISGKLDFTVTDMKKLKSLDLSSNQISDIEYFKAQYEFIAKDNGMEINDYLVSSKAPTLNLKNQDLSMSITVNNTNSNIKIELPPIFRQLEELQWKETSFGINSLYGNVTSDGKYVILNTNSLGKRTAQVTVLGTGIGAGTACTIEYTVTDSNDDDNDKPNEIHVTINTNAGSSVKAVKEVNNTNYVLVSDNTTAEQVLKEVTLNTDAYKVVIKDKNANNTVENTEKLKTNNTLVIDGLEDKAKCIIVVKGDITGDGSIGMSDILKLNQYRNNKLKLTDAEILAGNVVDSDDKINMSDILKLNQYRLNKINEL